MAALPTDIITEILSRLPVISLLCFKTVCKSWYFLMKSPKFIKLHLTQTLISDSRRYLLLSYSSHHSSDPNLNHNHLLYSNIDLNPNHLAFSELHHPLNHRETNFIGSCNGVVCFSDKLKNDVYLYNPLTNSKRKLPPNLTPYPGNMSLVFGFCYDSETDDYKVLRLLQDCHINEVNYSEGEVYSLRSNSWKFVVRMPYFLLYLFRHGVVVNEAVHYLVVTKEFEMRRKFIAGFDFKTETYSIMDCPKYDGVCKSGLDMGELGGCLSLLIMYQTAIPVPPGDYGIDFWMDHADLWVMKEYGKKESWVRLFRIPQTENVGMYLQVRTMVYSRNRRRILLEFDFLGLGWYDLETKTFDRFTELPVKAPIYSGVFLGSLVSLGNDKLKSEGEITKTIQSVPRKNTNK